MHKLTFPYLMLLTAFAAAVFTSGCQTVEQDDPMTISAPSLAKDPQELHDELRRNNRDL